MEGPYRAHWRGAERRVRREADRALRRGRSLLLWRWLVPRSLRVELIGCERRLRRPVTGPDDVMRVEEAIVVYRRALDVADACLDQLRAKLRVPFYGLAVAPLALLSLRSVDHGPDPCAEVCRLEGRCGLHRGACVALDWQDCRDAVACTEHGRCSSVDLDSNQVPPELRGTCVALHDGDCSRSAACRERGACIAEGGGCVTEHRNPCALSDACSDWGACTTAEDGTCVVASDEDCFLSYGCQQYGACRHHDGACVVRFAGDCARSHGCKALDRCALIDDECRTFPGEPYIWR